MADETSRQCKMCLAIRDISCYGRYVAAHGKVHHSKTCGYCVEDPPIEVELIITRASGATEVIIDDLQHGVHTTRTRVA
jgi:hypothetical protein